MIWQLLLILPFIVSLVLCRLMMAVSVRDAPDGGRKQQDAPVPTAGGVAILAAIAAPLVGLAVLAGVRPEEVATGLIAVQPFGSWVLFVLGLGLVGVIDDWIGLPAMVKFVLLAAASVAVATQLPAVDLSVPWISGGPEATDTVPLLMVAGLALWIFVFVNATNFMDGADGLAMGSLAVMFAGIGIGLGVFYRPMLEFVGEAMWMVLLTPVVAVAAIAGFLVWNLPGKIYAGDTGALAIGGLFAVMAAFTGAHLGIWYPLILALPFLVDVGMTLAYRALRRQNLLKAHREHAYQVFIRRGASPVRVSILWWAFSVICLFAAIAVLRQPEAEREVYGAGLFLVLAVSGAVLWIWQRVTQRARVRASARTREAVKLTPTAPTPPAAPATSRAQPAS
ncbi:MAG: hypothetical protein AAF253_00030 [Pseudomonadota bacterium]